MEDISKRRKSLATTKGKDTSHKVKPLVIKGGLTKSRTPYKNSGKYFHNILDVVVDSCNYVLKYN